MRWSRTDTRRGVALALAIACLAAGAAGAAGSLDAAHEAFDEGRFLEAADVGEALGTGPGLAMAAEALAIHGYYLAEDDTKQPLFKRAMALASKAVEIDPDNPQAHLQASHAMGRYAQTIGVLEALNEGFAERIRERLDAALALDPDLVGAHLSLAAWHAEIVASAGFMAGILYGADQDEALAHYQKAMDLAPDDPAVNLEYGIGLLTLDEDDFAGQARAFFERAIALPADTAYERIVRDEARRRLAALDG